MGAFAFATAISLLASPAVARGGVVSLNLCTDELVLLIARPEQIRSVSYLSHAPEETILWRRARRYRPNDGSMLAAAALRPKLVVTTGAAGRDLQRLASGTGAQLLALPFPMSLQDVAENVVRVGQATGNPVTAGRIVAAMAAARRSTPRPAREAVWVDGAGRSLSAQGLGAAWLRLAGLSQRPLPGDRMTLESMIVRPPRILLQSRYRAGQTSSAVAWQRHPAARRARVPLTLATDGRRWTCMGPTLLPEILRLRRRAGQ